MGGEGGGGLDEQFDESLGDFEESIGGGAAGGGGQDDIDILDPMGGGSSGSQGDEPLYEEGDVGGEGGMNENQAVAQRAEGGAPGGQGGGEGGSQQSGQAGGGEQGEGGADEGEESASENSAGGSGSGAGGGAQSSNRDVGSIGSGNEPTEMEPIQVPEDIGDGRSDDIVLRQIRDAAMNEQDPVLREKLWDEYRRISGER
jgi:hypothetical protein